MEFAYLLRKVVTLFEHVKSLKCLQHLVLNILCDANVFLLLDVQCDFFVLTEEFLVQVFRS